MPEATLPLRLACQFLLQPRRGAWIDVDDRDMVQVSAVLFDRFGIVGAVHQVITTGDPGGGDGGERNGHLTVMHRGGGQHATNRYAHHLRELKALVEIEKEDWARHMQRLLRAACHATNLAREADAALKPDLIALIERRYDAIIAAGMAFHEAQPALGKLSKRGRQPRRVGHNLLLRLLNRKQDVLRFLTDRPCRLPTTWLSRTGE